MIEKIYTELKVGQKAFIEKTITETDVYLYAGISGDFSWLHVNEVRAASGHFQTRIAHGILLVGLISNVVDNHLPGAGTIYEMQSATFLKPCFFNDTIRAEVEVLELLPRGRVKIRTTCWNQHGDMVVDGEAIAIPPRRHVIEVEGRE